MRAEAQPTNPHEHRPAVTQKEPRRDDFASAGLPTMTSCHGSGLLDSLLPTVRVARRHAARVGDQRDRRRDDRGYGAGGSRYSSLPSPHAGIAPTRKTRGAPALRDRASSERAAGPSVGIDRLGGPSRVDSPTQAPKVLPRRGPRQGGTRTPGTRAPTIRPMRPRSPRTRACRP